MSHIITDMNHIRMKAAGKGHVQMDWKFVFFGLVNNHLHIEGEQFKQDNFLAGTVLPSPFDLVWKKFLD